MYAKLNNCGLTTTFCLNIMINLYSGHEMCAQFIFFDSVWNILLWLIQRKVMLHLLLIWAQKSVSLPPKCLYTYWNGSKIFADLSNAIFKKENRLAVICSFLRTKRRKQGTIFMGGQQT